MDTVDHLFKILREKNQPLCYQLFTAEGGTVSHLPDGTRVVTDAKDRLVQVEYNNGSKVIRHSNYVVVQSTDKGYWFGNSQGQWFQFD